MLKVKCLTVAALLVPLFGCVEPKDGVKTMSEQLESNLAIVTVDRLNFLSNKQLQVSFTVKNRSSKPLCIEERTIERPETRFFSALGGLELADIDLDDPPSVFGNGFGSQSDGISLLESNEAYTGSYIETSFSAYFVDTSYVAVREYREGESLVLRLQMFAAPCNFKSFSAAARARKVQALVSSPSRALSFPRGFVLSN